MSDSETPLEPSSVSMIDAARRIGVSKSTMHRYIKNGRVSAERTEDGTGYIIQLRELYRVFPEAHKRPTETVSETPEWETAEQGETPRETPNEVISLRTQVKMLREMLARADLEGERDRRAAAEQIDDLRARLDREGEERRTLNARLLTYQMPPTPADMPHDPPSGPPPSRPHDAKRGGLFGLFRRAG